MFVCVCVYIYMNSVQCLVRALPPTSWTTGCANPRVFTQTCPKGTQVHMCACDMFHVYILCVHAKWIHTRIYT